MMILDDHYFFSTFLSCVFGIIIFARDDGVGETGVVRGFCLSLSLSTSDFHPFVPLRRSQQCVCNIELKRAAFERMEAQWAAEPATHKMISVERIAFSVVKTVMDVVRSSVQ
jgi:hypothetical protein